MQWSVQSVRTQPRCRGLVWAGPCWAVWSHVSPPLALSQRNESWAQGNGENRERARLKHWALPRSVVFMKGDLWWERLQKSVITAHRFRSRLRLSHLQIMAANFGFIMFLFFTVTEEPDYNSVAQSPSPQLISVHREQNVFLFFTSCLLHWPSLFHLAAILRGGHVHSH